MKHRAEWTKVVQERLAKGIPAATVSDSAQTKYGNRKENGYDSLKEAHRAAQLALMERAGSITDLRRQVKFDLIPAQYIDGQCVERAVTYTADFCYKDGKGRLVAEDVKGYRTQQYILRRKLMLWLHHIQVMEM